MIQKDVQSYSDDLTRLSAYTPRQGSKRNVKKASSRWLRFSSFGLAIAMHLLFLYWLENELALITKPTPKEIITLLDFIKPELVLRDRMPDMYVKHPTQILQPGNSLAKPPIRMVIVAKNPQLEIEPNRPLKIYDVTGRVGLPADFVEKTDSSENINQRFDFLNPNRNVDTTFLKHRAAIEYSPTQFDKAYQPDQDLLTEVLQKAVEKTTLTIRIPIPGNPRGKLVCKVAILALGGGCGYLPNGGFGRVVPEDEDDPNTLNPEEDKQCQAWWEKINNTHSQREWRNTRELYELTCKKPLAKEKIKTQ